MNQNFIQTYTTFIQTYNRVLELELKLLHSTEIEFAIVEKNIRDFIDFLGSIEKHKLLPHILKFNDLNKDEFVRAESEHLRQLATHLNETFDNLCGYLLVNKKNYSPQYTVDTLADRLTEQQSEKSVLSFGTKQIDIIRNLIRPLWLYGPDISRTIFGIEQIAAPKATNSAKKAEKPLPKKSDDIDSSVIKLKVDLVSRRMKDNPHLHIQAGVTTLLKIKHWLSLPGNRENFVVNPFPKDFNTLEYLDNNLELFQTEPTQLICMYHGNNNLHVLVNWFLRDPLIATLIPNCEIPNFSVPGVSGLFLDDDGKSIGSFYLTAKEQNDSALSTLSELIKQLDFVEEYLFMADAVTPKKPKPVSEEDRINNLAELL